MKAIKFELSGRTAMFKKPDVNSYAYFTYNNIHKIAILGIIGSILGLGGYIQQTRDLIESEKGKVKSDKKVKPVYPEFYEKLKNLKISVLPYGSGYFTKKIQVFNNSVGYASREEGGNLIVREQWLENPKWDIYILEDGSIDDEIYAQLKDYLLNSKCEFIPYLGKNDHVANIEKSSVVDLQKCEFNYISSVFINKGIDLGQYPYDDDSTFFLLREVAPVTMNEDYNFYEYQEFVMTNLEILNAGELDNVYSHEEKSLYFF